MASCPPAATRCHGDEGGIAADEPGTLDGLRELLPRYQRALPRYTSYPTAPVWHDDFGDAAFRDALSRIEEDVSVYVHVPFCRSLCHFCACNRTIPRSADAADRYLTTLEREIRRVRRAAGAGVGCAQLHLGGGTPTYLEPEQLRRLVDLVTDAFPLRRDAEASIEVDPRVTTPEHVETIARCGFDRVSLGVQDLDPVVQQAIHRIQPKEVTRALVSRLRAVGISGIGMDLIYGLPYQTVASFERTVEEVIDLDPDRIALYAYAHVTNVAKQQRSFERKDLPDAATRLDLFCFALRRLSEAGYVYIGLDHFARRSDPLARALADDSLHRNFMGHTTRPGLPLIGLGPSAISELPGLYAQNRRTVDDWERALAGRGLATFRGHLLSEDDLERRFVINRILCSSRVDAASFTRRFGRRFANRFAPELERLAVLENDGLLSFEADGGFELSLAGRVLARNVAATFDAHLGDDAETRFSQAV